MGKLVAVYYTQSILPLSHSLSLVFQLCKTNMNKKIKKNTMQTCFKQLKLNELEGEN